MARFSTLVVFALAALASAAPLKRRQTCTDVEEADDTTATAPVATVDGLPDFKNLQYADIQISSGVAGNAKEEAEANFVVPFANLDLATIPDDVQDAIETLREAAEDAETELFNPAIAAADGAEADALQVGKIKNKVLKLTAFETVLKIKLAKAQAAGDDTSDIESKITDEQTKLSNNIKTDQGSAGETSQAVV
ncbi:hypothetical protein EXIGLDRAFT_831333 [Exidia glandulosa HHB12029]|uniref:Small secreted protein n=1 Tax=Exidia glandulosa HHB12029 TaxID=1314781 RepID=A0A165MPY0_EXIGL|nr:hypothetical protein EXIGLDRAFT_831333 [Exidia glandulosa HHB12029]